MSQNKSGAIRERSSPQSSPKNPKKVKNSVRFYRTASVPLNNLQKRPSDLSKSTSKITNESKITKTGGDEELETVKISWSGIGRSKSVDESFTERSEDDICLPNLPNLRLNPISMLEKKYNTNFGITKSPVKCQKSIETKLVPSSRSLSLNSSKLFATFAKEKSKGSQGSISGAGSLQDILCELKSDHGNTSELLDKGVNIDNLDFEDSLDNQSSEMSDFSSDDYEELEKKINSNSQRISFDANEKEVSPKISLSEMEKHTSFDLHHAAIFSKDISNEEVKIKDPFENINMAKISFTRPWLSRYQIQEVHEKWYGSKTKKRQFILKVKTANDSIRTLVIRDSWLSTVYEPGEIIHVIGENAVVIDDSQNYLILNPDTLISATALSDAVSCERKSVLNSRYNGPPSSSVSMVVGNIIHEVFQFCIAARSNADNLVEEVLRQKIDENIIEIMALEETRESINSQCERHLDYIKSWISQHFLGTSKNGDKINTISKNQQDKSHFLVTKTLDVEENIWSPIFGLKGLIDVTIEASTAGKKYIVPLEIKTGYKYISHNAQSTLYTLLMKDRYEMEISSFVLLYTRSAESTKYNIDPQDLRMLLVKRNNLSKYMKEIQQKLPPLAKSSVCDRCFTKKTCMEFAKLAEDTSVESSGFNADEYNDVTDHMTAEDSKFYKHWEDLVNKEENFINRLAKELWIFTSQERENFDGKALANLKVKDVHFDSDSRKYTYTFERSTNERSLTMSQISHYDNIMISDEKGHFSISSGIVNSISSNTITVTTARRIDHSNVRKPGFNSTFNQSFETVLSMSPSPVVMATDRKYRIDKNPTATGLKLARFNLLETFSKNSKGCLRDILVRNIRKPSAKEPLVPLNLSQNHTFNSDQVNAIKECFSTNDFRLLLGMPGTGKTTVIAEMVSQLVAANRTVLLASYTHSAVDNILIKLKDRGVTSILRLGMPSRVHESIRQFCPYNDDLDPSKIKSTFMDPAIVATTCLGVTDWLFNHRRFDYCIIDEASQVSMPICLGPLRFSDRFILVGDHYQLPPLVLAPHARSGLSKSLFWLLSERFPESVSELQFQYRMCSDIMVLSNTLVYGGRLKCGSGKVANKTLAMDMLQLDHHRIQSSKYEPFNDWFRLQVLDPYQRVVFLDLDNIHPQERVIGDKVDNPLEADFICQIVKAMMVCGVAQSAIGILSLYKAQIRLFARKLHQYKELDILTADRFQGLDKDCVIISLVRANDNKNTGDLMKEWRRINVAITRAKCKLIVVGSKKTLQNLAAMEAFMKVVENKGWMVEVPVTSVARDSPLMSSLSSSAALNSTKLEVIAATGYDFKENSPLKSTEKAPTKKDTPTTTVSSRLLQSHPLLMDILEVHRS